ncbi:hypothetical protein [Hymenobacter fodinae]|uniref:Uncharacterized protein n=1 Tax=Hymenobacter fodinae TaxID=2510796 RepID=A0A4Z0P6G1_9BACT|nr:hypothetical protein [Hymenobacter fodinae]TGE06257.1 hypothetical protein EU556_15500 [Hymenobacter fodinae]
MLIKQLLKFFLLLLCASPAIGQTVIQGDSVFQGLQVGKSTLNDVRRVMGNGYKKGEMIRRFHVKWSDDRPGSYQVVYGYTLAYKRAGVEFAIETENKPKDQQSITSIKFRSKASIVTSKGIYPSNTFADVINRYGPLDTARSNRNIPYVYGWRIDRGQKTEKRYTIIQYTKGIRFVSYGSRNEAENLNIRRVDEIWLD